MIIIKAQGGLGNQMFQYALYKAFKLRGKNVKMDVNSSGLNIHNGFELERVFNLEIEYATGEECFYELSRNYINEMYNCGEYSFQANVLNINNGYLDGYWQHEEYFKDIKDEILKKYCFKNINGDRIHNLLEQIENNQSVSIHIRRGDYVNIDNYNNISTIDYYKEAINIIENKRENPVFFIFSDDVEWVKKNMKIKNSYLVNFNSGLDSYKDMFLMSRCKDNIIANSTFSWWAAWLNTYSKKIVIRPYIWTNEEVEGSTICSSDGWRKCGEKLRKENIDLSYRQFSLNQPEYKFLNELFVRGKYEEIKKFNILNNEYIEYFKFRIAIIENKYNKVIEHYNNFFKFNSNNQNFDIEVSAMFHFGQYMFNCNRYEEAKSSFLRIDEITNGKHIKAMKYLQQLRGLGK